ncbi:MAG: Integral membrane protein MviN [Parcubacteria group bacterium Gr01-1014_70]|nr:MAG: Integral membrane protein MviN [Parcubacteria group bacterium Gr01-1014_70]
MRRLLELFHREFRDVREAAFLLAAATIVSNLLALLRDRLLASRFGAGPELDVYYAAFRIPDLLYAFSLFFVASTVIIPFFLERLTESEEKAREFVSAILFAFFISIVPLIIILYVSMPYIAPYYIPGFDAGSTEEVVRLARILLLSPLLLGLSGLVSSVLQACRKFFVYAASFLFYNAGIIVGILVFVPRWGLRGLGWGVVLGACLHLLIQMPSLVRSGFVPSFAFGRLSDLAQVFRKSFPRTLGLTLTQFTFLAITALASTLSPGSLAIFQLSFNLQAVPFMVIGLSYSVAAFPTMAELIVKKERDVFYEHVISSVRHIIFWTLPAAVLFLVLRAHVVRVVLGAGEFGWADTRLVAASLAVFSLGIVAQSLSALYVRAFYAIGNVRIPVFVNMGTFAVTILGAYVFVEALLEMPLARDLFFQILRVSDVPNASVLGLPLAFSVGALVNVLLLGYYLRRVEGKGIYRSWRLSPFLGEMGCASALVGVVSYGVLQLTSPMLNTNTFWGIFLHGLIAGICGLGVGVLFLHFLGNKELMDVRSVLGRKFWRKDVVASLSEQL